MGAAIALVNNNEVCPLLFTKEIFRQSTTLRVMTLPPAIVARIMYIPLAGVETRSPETV